jgi:hypothetical protein
LSFSDESSRVEGLEIIREVEAWAEREWALRSGLVNKEVPYEANSARKANAETEILNNALHRETHFTMMGCSDGSRYIRRNINVR